MSSRELMPLLSSFFKANNIQVHKDLNDMPDLSRHGIPKMTRAITRGPTVDDEISVQYFELWAARQKHDEPTIPKCPTRVSLRHRQRKRRSDLTPYRAGHEDRSCPPSELVCFSADGDIPCLVDRIDAPVSPNM